MCVAYRGSPCSKSRQVTRVPGVQGPTDADLIALTRGRIVSFNRLYNAWLMLMGFAAPLVVRQPNYAVSYEQGLLRLLSGNHSKAYASSIPSRPISPSNSGRDGLHSLIGFPAEIAAPGDAPPLRDGHLGRHGEERGSSRSFHSCGDSVFLMDA